MSDTYWTKDSLILCLNTLLTIIYNTYSTKNNNDDKNKDKQ